ncbi:MAG: sensor histidine kinase [Clostridia bacterium]|nr:sensor histidine kinase [Clostridia bacterium]
MTRIGSVFYMVELLVAELIFLYACPKRSKFFLRLILAFVGGILIAYLFPIPEELRGVQWYIFIRQVLFIATAYIFSLVCFRLNGHVTLSLCMAGLAVQHLTYLAAGMLQQIEGVSDWKFGILGASHICELIVVPPLYVLIYFTLGRAAAKEEYYKTSNLRLDILAISIILFNNVINRVAYYFEVHDSPIFKIYGITVNLLALIIQFLLYGRSSIENEKQLIEKMWKEDKIHYALTKGAIDVINLKMHDMKHRLDLVNSKMTDEEIKSIRDSISLYDSSVNTGNEVINVVLMDYNIRYAKEGVVYTFNGDGALFSFMKETDIYTLFGNAISNASEAVLKLPIEDRGVFINVESKGEFVTFSVRNRYDGVYLHDGTLPKTSKEDNSFDHGYGVRSMAMLAQKYGGDLRISTKDKVFTMTVFMIKS